MRWLKKRLIKERQTVRWIVMVSFDVSVLSGGPNNYMKRKLSEALFIKEQGNIEQARSINSLDTVKLDKNLH